jgi:hypothetical protein
MNAHVETLIKKAAEAADSGDAMRYAQAALNAANAAIGLSNIKKT